MKLDEYIQSNGNTRFDKFEKTFIAAQRIEAFDVIEEFIRQHKPDKILEIGTAAGGLTSFINHVGKEANEQFKMISTDISERPEYDAIINEGVTILIEDIFSWETETVKNSIVLDFLSDNSKKIIFCDGGNKKVEFKILAKYLNVGDFILAHDYIDTTENFVNNFAGKIWNWMEVCEEDLADVCEQHNLEEYNKEMFSPIVWACRQKTHRII